MGINEQREERYNVARPGGTMKAYLPSPGTYSVNDSFSLQSHTDQVDSAAFSFGKIRIQLFCWSYLRILADVWFVCSIYLILNTRMLIRDDDDVLFC